MDTNSLDNNNYKQRVVAYFDILGFKELISDSEQKQDTTKIKSILEIFHTVTDPKRPNILRHSNYDQKRFCSTFSDNIVISFDVDLESEVQFTLDDILEIIIQLLYRNVLVRGSVVLGNMYHDQNYLFGSGLIRAYEFEQHSLYPRIIVDRNVVDIAKKYPSFFNTSDIEESMVKLMLSQDLDGLFYIDYFNFAENTFVNGVSGMDEYYEKLRETIINIQSISEQNVSINMKYKWLQKKYNDGIKDINKYYKTKYKRI